MLDAGSSDQAASHTEVGSGASGGFEAFYVANYHQVVAVAVALSGDRGQAEDLAQEAFAAAHGRWAELSDYDNPAAWVRRVVANKSVSGYRRSGREARGLRLIGAPPSAELPYGTEHRAELWAAVRCLPVRQAQAVALFYIGDRSVASVAEQMGLSEGAVKSHLSRARRTLARELGMEENG